MIFVQHIISYFFLKKLEVKIDRHLFNMYFDGYAY